MKNDPVGLNVQQRACVEKAVKETCRFRQWDLYAVNARPKHVHLVVSASLRKAELMLNAFKANATREMRESGWWPLKSSPWAKKGSEVNLWNEQSITEAVDYVLYAQGDEPTTFG
jgi:REP element-mobilizing transposase RayT